MNATAPYRKHHDELRSIAGQIESVLDAEAVAADPTAIAEIVRKLFGKFTIHLALEDNSLYPRCLNHSDQKLRSTAQRFQNDMGGLAGLFDEYKRKWPGPLAITRDPSRFVVETRDILGRLRSRVAKEEEDFYRIADAVF